MKVHLRSCKACHRRFLQRAARLFFQPQDAPKASAEPSVAAYRVEAVAEPARGMPHDWALLFDSRQSLVPKRDGRKVLSPLSTPDLPFALSKCESVREVVEWLYGAARTQGFQNVRYHFFSPRDGRLVSVEGVGHPPDVEAQLRRGSILRTPTSGLTTDYDSYICFYYDRPVVFQIDEGAAGLVGPIWLHEQLPHFRLNRDHCENVLMSRKSRAWTDFPLAGLGRFVGKLSCDLALLDVSSLDGRRILDFWRVAQMAAPYLETMYNATINDAFEEVRDQIEACGDDDSLLSYLTTDLPQHVFHCQYASVFAVSQDSEGHRLLVLEKTTYPRARRHENRKAYRWDSAQYVVPWVARSRSGVRINDAANRVGREEQCRAYEVSFRWDDPFVDWSEVGSQLAAPLLSSRNQVVGVIQFLGEHAREGARPQSFSDAELRLAHRLGSELIGARLLALHGPQGEPDVNRWISWGLELSELKTAEAAQIPERLTGLLEFAVPEYNSRKLYMVCLLDENNAAFSSVAVRGRLQRQFGSRERYRLEQTITERAIHASDRAVFWNELPRGRGARASRLVTPRAICALACGIRERNRSLGALVVKSDRYDLSEERQGPLLERLAAEAARWLFRG